MARQNQSKFFSKKVEFRLFTSSHFPRTACVRPLDIVFFVSHHIINVQGSEAGIRAIFEFARRQAPCILVLEDLDSMVIPSIRSFFLNEIDGLVSEFSTALRGCILIHYRKKMKAFLPSRHRITQSGLTTQS